MKLRNFFKNCNWKFQIVIIIKTLKKRKKLCILNRLKCIELTINYQYILLIVQFEKIINFLVKISQALTILCSNVNRSKQCLKMLVFFKTALFPSPPHNVFAHLFSFKYKHDTYMPTDRLIGTLLFTCLQIKKYK